MADSGRGEGSRGGHIIGHTHSGHPIYGPGHGHYANIPGDGESSKGLKIRQYQAFTGPLKDRYKGFSSHDHLEAAKQHLEHAHAFTRETDAHRAAAKPEAVNWHAVVAAHTKRMGHEHASLAHFAAAGHENPYKAMEDAEVKKSLAKAEGSRGGHIIGHTKSGKPIYDTRHAKNLAVVGDAHRQNDHIGVITSGSAARQEHLGFTRDDHLEAADHHQRIAGTTADRDERRDSHVLAQAHAVAALTMKKPKDTDLSPADGPPLKKSGEGSKGGHVIGHTKTGKPIYQGAHGASGRLVPLGVKGYSVGDHADAAAAHTSLMSSGLPEAHASDARKMIAYHQKKAAQAPAPTPPAGIQTAVPNPATPKPEAAPKAEGQNPARALTSLSNRVWGVKTDEAAISSGQYKKDKAAMQAHALKVHDQHFKGMSPADHLALAQKPVEGKTGAERAKSMASRTAHGAMAHAVSSRELAAAKPKGAPGVTQGLPPPAPAAQTTAKSATHSVLDDLGLEDGDEITVLTPAEQIKLVDRVVQNMRMAGLDVDVEGTSDGGYSIRRRTGGQPVQIRPDGAVRAPEALVLFALGDDQALEKAGVAVPGAPSLPKPPAMPAMPKVASPAAAPVTAAPKPPGNAVLGKTTTGGTVWAHAKADSPIYRAFGPRDHAQAANLHQLAGNHAEAGAHRAMHAKLTAPKAPAMSPSALAARPKMGMGRLAMSQRGEGDMVTWASQDVLGDWLGKAKKGEGSRGGHIIGHTKSGKPVYAHGNGDWHEGRLGEWTKRDHLDAADLHTQRAQAGGGRRPSSHKAFALEHAIAATHEPEKPRRQRGGTGGGKTKSGKAILSAVGHEGPYVEVRGDPYDKTNDARWGAHLAASLPHFSAQDHRDAAAHHTRQQKTLLRQDRWGEALAPELAARGHMHAATMVKSLRKAGLMSLFHKPKMPAVPAAVAAAPAAAPAPAAPGGHSGEGSHGGQVIGHTRTGKPIYASHAAHQYPSFSVGDHMHAMSVHEAHANAASKAGDTAGHQLHSELRMGHFKVAQKVRDREEERDKIARLPDHMRIPAEAAFNAKYNPKRKRTPRVKASAGTAPAEGAPAATQAEA